MAMAVSASVEALEVLPPGSPGIAASEERVVAGQAVGPSVIRQFLENGALALALSDVSRLVSSTTHTAAPR